MKRSMRKILLIMTCSIFALNLITSAQGVLKAHYKLDETSGTIAADASGNGFDATLSGTTSWVAGERDGALEFGGDAAVTLPAAIMGLTSAIGSVSLWMNAGVPAEDINTMFWAGDNTTGGGFGAENEMHIHIEEAKEPSWSGGECSFFIIADPNTFLFSDPEKGTDPAAAPVNPLLLGDTTWHHIVGTFGEDKTKLYIDDSLIMETDYNPTNYALDNIFLGQMGGGQRKYTGKLDDVRIFIGVLTEEQITELYQPPPSHISDNPVANSQFVLYENYPNPFNGITTISYQLAENSDVLLTIYNQTGKLVRTLVQEKQVSGFQSISWDGCDDAGQQLSSGIYLYRLQVDNNMQTRKLILIE